MPLVIYYLIKDIQALDEDKAQPIVEPAESDVFPGVGDQVRFGGELYCVEKVLWDLFPEGLHETVVSIGLVTFREAIEQELIKYREEHDQPNHKLVEDLGK